MGAEYYFNNMSQWAPGIAAVGALIGIFILAFIVADDIDMDVNELQPTRELRAAVRELFFNDSQADGENESDEDQDNEQNNAKEE